MRFISGDWTLLSANLLKTLFFSQVAEHSHTCIQSFFSLMRLPAAFIANRWDVCPTLATIQFKH